MALAIVTVASSIASMSITGVTMKALNNISSAVQPRDCPLIQPAPENFISGMTVTRDAYGPDAQARKTARYTLNYRFFYMPIGVDRATYFAKYSDFVTLAAAILDAFIANSSPAGAVDLTPPEAFNFGIVQDPTGTQFHGFDVPLGIMEFIN